jgi:HlyD family secretion protein
MDTAGQAGGPAINALGTVRPAQTLLLGFRASGPVRTVSVSVGQDVRAGDLLAELDSTGTEIELQNAQQEVAVRQAALEALTSGPDGVLARRAEREHLQQLAEAQIALQVAQGRLDQARLQDHAPTVAAARSRQQQLELQLAQARAESLQSEVVSARVAQDRAQEGLQRVQTAYKEALDRPWEPQSVRDAAAQAVLEAERELRLAQARLASVTEAQRARELGLDLLAARAEEAAEETAQSLDAQAAYSITLSLLSAEAEMARVKLEGLQAWENPHLDPKPAGQIAQARGRLRQAELAVAQIEWQLEGAAIRAPFDGVVSAVYANVGEWVPAGEPVLEVLDTSRWEVETRNVGELSIGLVETGQEARVRVLALPGQTLGGQVVTISPLAVVQQGDTTYTLSIALEPTDLPLRPGMNVEVEIRTER